MTRTPKRAAIALIAVAIVAFIVFLGTQVDDGNSRPAEGDEAVGPPAEVSPPPGYPTPPPDLPTPAPLDYRDYPMPPEEATPAPPSSLEINGITVPLLPGMVYGIQGSAPPLPRPGTAGTGFVPQSYHFIDFVAPGATSHSWVHFDEDGESGRMRLLTRNIRPDDQLLFEPILAALAD
jgi:hypothetical protein